jgi:hypothetical protein
MNKTLLTLTALLLAMSAQAEDTKPAKQPNTHAGRAVDHAAKSFSHASGSAAHSIAASAQVTSAASAIPLSIGASVGAVSGQMAKESMKAATAPIGTPLEVTDEALTSVPPNEALKQKVGKPDEKL